MFDLATQPSSANWQRQGRFSCKMSSSTTRRSWTVRRFPFRLRKFTTTTGASGASCSDEALAGCARKHVDEERQFIRDLRGAILAEFQKGTGFLAVPKAVKLPQYAHWAGYDDWLEMNTLRLMTDLWMGPFPWYPDAK